MYYRNVLCAKIVFIENNVYSYLRIIINGTLASINHLVHILDIFAHFHKLSIFSHFSHSIKFLIKYMSKIGTVLYYFNQSINK